MCAGITEKVFNRVKKIRELAIKRRQMRKMSTEQIALWENNKIPQVKRAIFSVASENLNVFHCVEY